MTAVLTQPRPIRLKGRSYLALTLTPELPFEDWLVRLDDLAGRQKRDLCIFLRDDKALSSIAERVKPREGVRSDGKISLVMILDDGAQEIEIELPGRYPVNQQLANAVRAAPGVVNVELR